jgi:diguanylate cyclase (GGDEF)-like protein
LDTITFNLLERTVDQTNGDIKDVLSQARQDLVLFSQNPVFAFYFTEPDKKERWSKEIEKVLIAINNRFSDALSYADLIDRDGKELFKIRNGRIAHSKGLDPDESRHRFFKSGLMLSKGEVHQGDPYFSEDIHQWVIPFLTPIEFPDGRKAALLHMDLNISYLEEILKEKVQTFGWLGRSQKTGKAAELFILDSQGHFAAHTQMQIHSKKNRPRALDVYKSSGWAQMMEEMIHGMTGTEKIALNGQTFYFYFRPLQMQEDNGDIVSTGILVPADIIEKAVRIPNYLAVVTIGSLIVLLLAIWFGTGLTSPILDLTQATAAMASGNLQTRVNIHSQNEIGRLGNSFNQMAESLEKSYRTAANKSLQFQALYDAASALNAVTTSPEVILKALLEIARKVTDARFGAITIFDETGQVAHCYHVGLSPELEALLTTLPEGQGLLKALLSEPRPIRSDNLTQDPRFSSFPSHYLTLKSFLGTGIRARGKNLGSIYVAEKVNAQGFTEEDESLLVLIARDAAMAFENARLQEETQRQAKRDSLTGLYNRRHFEEQVREEIERSQRYHRPFSIVLLDLNDLKQINDRYGHLAGDRVLTVLSEVLMQNIRANDVVARYGGDEFVMLLPETQKAGAQLMTQRIREQLSGRVIILKNGPSLHLSASMGVATYPIDGLETESLIRVADQVLYDEKAIHRSKQQASSKPE